MLGCRRWLRLGSLIASQLRQRPHHLLLVAILCLTIWTGWRGIDFGAAFDEWRILESVSRTARDGVFLPGWYNYPSLPYSMGVAALLPDVLTAEGRDALVAASRAEHHHLRTRRVFLLVASLSMVWTYLLVLAERRSWPEAVLAAAILGSSWEIAYHSRWIAPDAMLAQFAILSVLLAATAWRTGRGTWLAAAAVAAGLSCGSKYTGGILLLPVLLAAIFSPSVRRRSAKQRALRSVLVASLFAVTFFVTTPGALLEPGEFVEDVLSEIRHYAEGHPGHTVESGFPYALRAGQYLSLVLLSPFPPVAAALFLLALLGAGSMLRRDGMPGLLVLCVPVLHFAFMCTNRVLTIRNLLLLAPFLAVFAARGAAVGWGSLRSPVLRGVSAAALVGCLTANYASLWQASESIRQRDRLPHGDRVLEYLDEHPSTRFALSHGVRRLLPESAAQREKLATGAAEACIFLSTEVRNRLYWPANVPGRYEIVSGARDVNFDYYPAWKNPKILAIPSEELTGMGLVGRRAPCADEGAK